MRARSARRSSWKLVAILSFAGIAASFAVSTIYTQDRMDSVDSRLEPVIEEAMPAIVHLTALRTRFRDVELMLAEAVDGHPWGRGAMRDVLASIDEEANAYRSFAGADLTTRDATLQAVVAFEIAAKEIRDAIDDGKLGDARERLHASLRPRMTDADNELGFVIGDSARRAARSASVAERGRRRTTLMALVMNVASALLALGFAAMAYRTARRHSTALEAHVEELSAFAARVAHDIRGPLTPAVIALHQMEKGNASSDALRESIRRGARSLKVVECLVDDLLAFARSGTTNQAGGFAPLRSAMEGVLAETQDLAASLAVELRVEPSSDAAAACGPGVLASILSNLVRNAIRYVDGGVEKRVTVRGREIGCVIRLEVEDTGKGVPLGLAETIFEPYVRGAHGREGLGLGLATVKRLATAHGGSVGVVLSTDGGSNTLFWVELPAATASHAS
jgi:signal transduction histidine kinase